MVKYIKGNGKKEESTAKVNTHGLMERFTKENIMKKENMEEALRYIQMEISTQGSLDITIKKEKEFMNGLMEINIWDPTKMIIDQALEY